MFTGLLHTHSLLRYFLLIFILISIAKSLNGWLSGKNFTNGDRKLALFTVTSAHLQLVIGLILYFISPNVKAGLADMGAAMKNASLRFWSVEHIAMMLIAIILITIGSARSKRAVTDIGKHKNIALFFLIALIIIFLAIPWPWSTIARGWVPGM